MATRYLEIILLRKLDDGLSPFPGGVCGIENRNLPSFFREILANVVQRGRSALSVQRRRTSKQTLPKWRHLTGVVRAILPSDLQPLFIVWTEELEGLVDLHILSPVLPNIELYAKEEKKHNSMKLLATTRRANELILSRVAPLVGTPIQFR